MTRVWRLVILFALAAAAVIAPTLVGGVESVDAQCRAVFGSRDDGICLDEPSAPAPEFPNFGLGPTDNGGPGITTGPLLPGQTFGGYVPIA
jgi:hypothetical protein